MDQNKKTRIVHMVTSPNSVGLMKGQLSYLKNSGYDVTVIASPGERLDDAVENEGINIKAISMGRAMSPFKDLISLIKIIIFFIKLKPQICNAGTPKAGLLGMLAAWITRIPYRVYTLRGIPLEGSSGIKKKILILTEKIACSCANKVICISPSLEKKAIELKLTTKNKSIVFGQGSSNGLQIEKYEYNTEIKQSIKEIQRVYNLKDNNFIIGYVGRINNFKGVEELVTAFEKLQYKHDGIYLLLIGPIEEKDPIPNEVYEKIKKDTKIIEVGRVNNPIPYYYLMDILAFPTHREGFGNVSIEAQATGTPVVTTNATGSVDTVVNNETGFVIDVGDWKALEHAIEEFINEPKLIEEMGTKGKKRVKDSFSSNIIWNGIKDLYRSGLKK